MDVNDNVTSLTSEYDKGKTKPRRNTWLLNNTVCDIRDTVQHIVLLFVLL